MILEGEIEVIKGDEPGRVVYVAGNGEAVGELAVLTDIPRSRDATCEERHNTWRCGCRDFRGHLRQHKTSPSAW